MHWAIMVTWVLFNAYAEGYRGFRKRYSPRTVARAFYLAEHPTTMRVILPHFSVWVCLVPHVILISSYVVILVVCLVIVIRTIEQPWRGIVDAGVVIGLGLGLLSILGYLCRVSSEVVCPLIRTGPQPNIRLTSPLNATSAQQ